MTNKPQSKLEISPVGFWPMLWWHFLDQKVPHKFLSTIVIATIGNLFEWDAFFIIFLVSFVWFSWGPAPEPKEKNIKISMDARILLSSIADENLKEI
ncbi:hypothetical protein GCM10017044_03130 [Kordiimonas sediminis]|uniref:Uncharacterized protein n=1 Tax=Kordiimonas sediminis TaxID=1735581 RepID=A0A919AK58_9PROT|nr:hypothetical protein [Kordiimonas sediminis]GHF12544.1 hypothetical protein GCM10017044_03130 [Kordiimonas sediminis]